MTDSYLSIAAIANNKFMIERMYAAVTQQQHLGSINIDQTPVTWVDINNYVWASSPSWGEKWSYALDSHPDDPNYDPGKDDAVITDEDILATIQALAGPSPTE